MAKHASTSSSTTTVNLVQAIAVDTRTSVKHKRTIVWLSLCGVASIFYILDLSHLVIFGFIVQHLEELVLTTGVARVIGE